MSRSVKYGAVREAAIRAVAAAYELWMLLPLWLLAHHFPFVNVGAAGRWLAAAVLVSAIGASLSVRVRKLWKQGITALLVAASAWGIMAASESFSPLGFITLTIAAMQGLTVSYRYWKIGWYWTGVGTYFLISALFRSVPEWDDYAALLTLGGLACLTIALFAVNRLHLRIVTLAENDPGRVPAELKRHNRLFVAAILVGILLLSAGLGGWIVHASKMIIRAIIGGLIALFRKGGDQQPSPLPATETPPPPAQLPPPNEPGWFAQLLDHLIPYIGAAICAALLGWGIYRLYRNGSGFWRKWLSRMAEWLRSSGNDSASAGFTDEQSSLFSWEEALGKLRRSRIGRLLARRKEPGWDELGSNRDRVRYLYRKWLQAQSREGYTAPPHLTPLEAVQDAKRWRQGRDKQPGRTTSDAMDVTRLIDVYYKGRYAEEEPTAEELAAIGKPRISE